MTDQAPRSTSPSTEQRALPLPLSARNTRPGLVVAIRLWLVVLALATAAGMLWVTGAWMFIATLSLDPACGTGRTWPLVLTMVVTAPLLGLGWSAAASIVITAIRARGLRGRAWLIGPGIAAVLAFVAGATSDPPRPAEPGECPRFEMSDATSLTARVTS